MKIYKEIPVLRNSKDDVIIPYDADEVIQIYMKNFANPKNLKYLRENYDKYNVSFKKEQRNIIFLDIDAVIQPYSSQKRFEYDPEPLIEDLCKKTNNDYIEKLIHMI